MKILQRILFVENAADNLNQHSTAMRVQYSSSSSANNRQNNQNNNNSSTPTNAPSATQTHVQFAQNPVSITTPVVSDQQYGCHATPSLSGSASNPNMFPSTGQQQHYPTQQQQQQHFQGQSGAGGGHDLGQVLSQPFSPFNVPIHVSHATSPQQGQATDSFGLSNLNISAPSGNGNTVTH